MAITADEARQTLEAADLLYDETAVEAILDDLADAISSKLNDTNPLLLCVMTGGLIPAAGLFSRFHFPVQLDYLHATRYQGGTRGAELEWVCEPSLPLQGRTVLVVDDILDEGLTLAAILDYCREQGAAAVYSVVLVKKLHDRCAAELQADFVGLKVEDRYVFGYGMDYHGYLRNVKGIYAVKDY